MSTQTGRKNSSSATASRLSEAHDTPRRLPPLLRRCWYSLNQAFRRRIMHLGLTPTQFTILRWLKEAGDEGLNQKDLAELMASDPNTIASLICRMKQAGQLQCSPDPNDGRAKLVHILAKGLEDYETARPLAIDLQETVLKAIPEQEREAFLKNLERLADVCNEQAKTD